MIMINLNDEIDLKFKIHLIIRFKDKLHVVGSEKK